jgi:uncharacterized membrane protein
MKTYVTVGLSLLAGAALFEAALIPGLVIGGAAVLAPRFLPNLRQRRRPLRNPAAGRIETEAGLPGRRDVERPSAALPNFTIKQAIAKTITFRVIVTTLDFSANYIVIGELATAAGLSAFALAAGPLFYLAHEMAWNRFGPSGTGVDVPIRLPLRQEAEPRSTAPAGFTISRAVAKTITFRTVATVMDFTANYLVVGDAATAALLSAFGFVAGPFIYLGHEKLWEYYDSAGRRAGAGPARLATTGQRAGSLSLIASR